MAQNIFAYSFVSEHHFEKIKLAFLAAGVSTPLRTQRIQVIFYVLPNFYIFFLLCPFKGSLLKIELLKLYTVVAGLIQISLEKIKMQVTQFD